MATWHQEQKKNALRAKGDKMREMYIAIQTEDAAEEGYFNAEQYLPIFGRNTSKIKYYETVPVLGGPGTIIRFYDENQTLILPEN